MRQETFPHRASVGSVRTEDSGKPDVERSAACVSDVGRSRDHNEDSFGEDASLGLWVVADGMGGHAAGEVASDLAVSHIFRLVADGIPVPVAVSKTHDLIRRAPSEGIGNPGMGTTVVVAQLTGWSYRVYWVGDSRAYVYGSDGLKRMTVDHTYVQRLLESGVITADEAEVHPERSVITQCLGAEGPQVVDVGEAVGELRDGEVLLLCTDGLTSELGDAEIAGVLGEENSIAEKAQRLVDNANANGGSDNITVALIPASAGARPAPTVARTREIPSIEAGRAPTARKWRRAVGWASVAVGIAAIATAGWLWREQVVEFATALVPYIRGSNSTAGSASTGPAALPSFEVLQDEDDNGENTGGPDEASVPGADLFRTVEEPETPVAPPRSLDNSQRLRIGAERGVSPPDPPGASAPQQPD